MTDASLAIPDPMDPARGAALAAALGLPFDPAAPLPPFFHQVHFWQAEPPGRLGRDGHPAVGTGGLIPDMGLPRRMWAGGRLEFLHPLVAGRPAIRHSRCDSVQRKDGRSGPLGFVTLLHEITQGGQVVVREWQDLVYRADPAPGTPSPPPLRAPDDAAPQGHRFDPVLLFRYSALTFNGHRIHYDRNYARDVEGYPGLVVHGPLLAQLLVLRAASDLGPLASFRFRAKAPLSDTETATLCHDGQGRLWVRGPDHRLVMEAEASAVPHFLS
jgi:3-methylfumaryl-CoA hydratase